MRFHNAAYDMLAREEVLETPELPELEFVSGSAWSSEHKPVRERKGIDLQVDHVPTLKEKTTVPRYFERIRETLLRTAADALMEPERGKSEFRCMSHAEFIRHWRDPHDDEFHAALAPLTTVIDQFKPRANPVFWLRLVGYGYVCNWYLRAIEAHAKKQFDVELEPPTFEVRKLLGWINNDKLPDSWESIKRLELHFQNIITMAL